MLNCRLNSPLPHRLTERTPRHHHQEEDESDGEEPPAAGTGAVGEALAPAVEDAGGDSQAMMSDWEEALVDDGLEFMPMLMSLLLPINVICVYGIAYWCVNFLVYVLYGYGGVYIFFMYGGRERGREREKGSTPQG